MKKSFSKFFVALIIGILLAVTLPVSAFAAENGAGEATDAPYLYCAFYDAADTEQTTELDGNRLSSGTYLVEVRLEGMETLSVFQYTAEYDPSVVTSLSTEATIVENSGDMSLGGIKVANAENGKQRVVIALASTDEVGTSLGTDHPDNVIATMAVTIACAEGETIDFQDVFRFVTDPDLTFAEADYNDGIEDVYALDIVTPTAYDKQLMTADESPENELEPETITVSGKILIASDAQGTASAFGLRGVKVYAYDNDNQVIAETVSNAAGDKSTWGDYSLELPAGTTNLMVGDYVVDTIVNRGFTIAGDADVEDANVAVVMCDYNDDTFINVIDKTVFNNAQKNEYSIYADFNNDEFVNVIDKTVFNHIQNGGANGINYTTELQF